MGKGITAVSTKRLGPVLGLGHQTLNWQEYWLVGRLLMRVGMDTPMGRLVCSLV